MEVDPSSVVHVVLLVSKGSQRLAQIRSTTELNNVLPVADQVAHCVNHAAGRAIDQVRSRPTSS
jgi:hypothetical protein